MSTMLRVGSIICLLLIAVCLSGCGLFGGSASYQFREPPAYYQSQRDEMVEHTKIHRQTELGRLEREATEFEADRRREDAHSDKAMKKKAWFKDWFGQGDETFMMSGEAKRINANLER